MRYAALLRAINVGGRVVTMNRLRDCFEELGFSGVETVVASGNVIFGTSSRSPRSLERRIEASLHDALGYDVATFVRTIPELESVVAGDPFRNHPARPRASLYIGFLARPSQPAVVARVHAAQTPSDAFHLRGRELYWLPADGWGKSDFGGARLEKLLGALTTVRNINTIEKIVRRGGG